MGSWNRVNGLRVAFSLLVATVLWLSAKLTMDYRTVFYVPVRYTQLPQQLKLTQPLPSRLGVTLSGKGHRLMLQALSIQGDTVDVPLAEGVRSGYVPTQRLYSLLSERLNLHVEQVQPDTLKLQFVEKVAKRVPIAPRLDYRLAEGYLLTQPLRLQPDSVTLIGTPAELARIHSWPTQPDALENVQMRRQRMVPLETSSEVAMSPREVLVTIAVERFTEGQVRVPIRREGVPPGRNVRLSPETALLRYRVPFSRYAEVRAEDFDLVVDVRDAAPEAQYLIPRLVLKPDFVREVRIEPRYVSYILSQRR